MGPGPGVHGGRVVVAGDDRRRPRVQGVADGPVPLGETVDRHAEAAANGNRQVAHGARRAGEQPQERLGKHSAGNADRGHRGLGLGEEHARQRDSTQGFVGSGSSTRARCRASTTGWNGMDHVHKVVTLINPRSGGTAGPIPRRTSDSTTLFAICSRRPRCPWSAGTRRGASASMSRAAGARMPGRGGDHHAAVLHARRRGGLRRLQGRAIQRRDARGDGAREDDR